MGFFGGGSRGRTDAGANRSTATKIGVGNINEKGKKTSNRNEFSSAAKKVAKFVATGGVTGAILRSLTSNSKKNKKSKSGDVYGYDEAKEKIDYKENPFTNGSGNDNQPKGIELAKASTGSATILGPGEIQKEAANNVKGPTTTEMSADEILLANKRKGRKQTNITAKATLAKNYKLSEKTLLG